MKLGIGSYTYGWHSGTYGWELTKDRSDHLSAEQIINRAADFGLSLVQLIVRPALDRSSDVDLRRAWDLAASRGVEIEIGTTGSDPENLMAWLRAGRILESKLMRTIFTQPSSGLMEERARLREVLPEFKAAGVAIAIENHETSSCRDLRNMIDDIGDPGVGVCLDSVNSLGRGEGTWEVVDALLPVTLNLHVKDFTVTRGGTDMGFTVVGETTGNGKLDIPRLIGEMHAANPAANVILEQWTPLVSTIDEAIAEQERWAVEGVTYLSAQIASVAG